MGNERHIEMHNLMVHIGNVINALTSPGKFAISLP